MVLKPRLIKKHSAKFLFLRLALGCPGPPLPPCNPWLPAVSFGSSLGNDNFPVYHLSVLSCAKLQNDISFLLISPKGKQHINSEVLRQLRTPDTSDMQTVHFFCLCSIETLSLLLLFILIMKCIPYHSSHVSSADPSGSHGFPNAICLVRVLLGPK